MQLILKTGIGLSSGFLYSISGICFYTIIHIVNIQLGRSISFQKILKFDKNDKI